MTAPEYSAVDIKQHIVGGNPTSEAPGLLQLLQHVKQIASSRIRQELDLPPNEIEDLASEVMLNALQRLEKGQVLRSYDPNGGVSLASYLAHHAPQRGLDRIRKKRNEQRMARVRHTSPVHIDTSFQDHIDELRFAPKPKKSATRPLQALGAQLGDKLEWSGQPHLGQEFHDAITLETSEWKRILDQARSRGQSNIKERVNNWTVSEKELQKYTPDPQPIEGKVDESVIADAKKREQNFRGQRRVVDNRKSKYFSACIDGILFPLDAKELQMIFALDTIANAAAFRSRGNRFIFDLLTTGTTSRDEKITQLFKSIKGEDETTDDLANVSDCLDTVDEKGSS